MIRVLVAEDSPTARALLVSVLTSEHDITVVGEAATGVEAVELAERLRPDLVTMDIQMPELDGIEATRLIMTRSPRPILIVSSAAESDVELSLEATRSGALMVIAKPQGIGSPAHESDRRQLVSMVRALSTVKVVRRHGASAAAPAPASAPRMYPGSSASPFDGGEKRHVELVAIAASTGGPAALRTILSQLPGDFPVPVVVVQHIARGFSGGLAQWLSGDSRLRVKLAELGEPLRNGKVYIAPDDRHLGVRRDREGALRAQLDSGPPVGIFRPSASYLFSSCAEHVGRGLLAFILTGMGDDGVAGLRDVHRLGGVVVAQDEGSSVIYGMPREAYLAGVVDQVMPLDDMARRLSDMVA